MTYRPLGCRESELWKNCAEPFAPRAKGISLGVGTHPSSLTSHSKFRSASAFFNIYLTAVVRNACAFTYLPTYRAGSCLRVIHVQIVQEQKRRA